MKKKVLEIIEKIIAEKREARKHPLIVLFSELERIVEKLPLEALRELYTENKVDFGRSINDNYITLRTDPNPRTSKVDLHKINQVDEIN